MIEVSAPSLRVICCYCREEIGRKPCAPLLAGQDSHGVCNECLPRLVNDFGIPMRDFLDALQIPMLIVKADCRVLAANHAAELWLSQGSLQMGGCLSGDVLRCIHASEPGGCGGTSHCQSCVIRTTITRTQQTGQSFANVPAHADVHSPNGTRTLSFYISTERQGDCVVLRVHDRILPFQTCSA